MKFMFEKQSGFDCVQHCSRNLFQKKEIKLKKVAKKSNRLEDTEGYTVEEILTGIQEFVPETKYAVVRTAAEPDLKFGKKMSRHVLMDLNVQMYENGGFIFGKWKDCRILLYSDSRMDWFFDQKKLVGSLNLIDMKEHVAFDGLHTKMTQNRPFVPKLIRANLLFSVATDQTAKYFHWFLFETKNDYNEFCDAVCSLIGKTRITKKKHPPRSPSVDPSKRKPRSHSQIPNRFRHTKNLEKTSQTPTPIRKNINNDDQLEDFADKN